MPPLLIMTLTKSDGRAPRSSIDATRKRRIPRRPVCDRCRAAVAHFARKGDENCASGTQSRRIAQSICLLRGGACTHGRGGKAESQTDGCNKETKSTSRCSLPFNGELFHTASRLFSIALIQVFYSTALMKYERCKRKRHPDRRFTSFSFNLSFKRSRKCAKGFRRICLVNVSE